MKELVAGDNLIFREHAVVAVAIGGEAAGFPHHQDAGRHVPGR